jgi:hypothetical protein
LIDGGGVGRRELELKEKKLAVADDEESSEDLVVGLSVDIVRLLDGGGGGAGVVGPVEANGDPKNAAVLLLVPAGVGASVSAVDASADEAAPPSAPSAADVDADASFGEGSGDGRPRLCVSLGCEGCEYAVLVDDVQMLSARGEDVPEEGGEKSSWGIGVGSRVQESMSGAMNGVRFAEPTFVDEVLGVVMEFEDCLFPAGSWSLFSKESVLEVKVLASTTFEGGSKGIVLSLSQPASNSAVLVLCSLLPSTSLSSEMYA